MKIPSSLISFMPRQKQRTSNKTKTKFQIIITDMLTNTHAYINTNAASGICLGSAHENNVKSSTKCDLATVRNALQSNLPAFSTDNPDGKDQLNRNRVALRYNFTLGVFTSHGFPSFHLMCAYFFLFFVFDFSCSFVFSFGVQVVEHFTLTLFHCLAKSFGRAAVD